MTSLDNRATITPAEFFDHCVQSVRASTNCEHFILINSHTIEFTDAASFLVETDQRRVARVSHMLLHPPTLTDGPGSPPTYNIGMNKATADSNDVWNFNPAFCASAPTEIRRTLDSPGKFLKTVSGRHELTKGVRIWERCAQEIVRITESCELSGRSRAVWLTPFFVHVSREASMYLQQCYIRDPHNKTSFCAGRVTFVRRPHDTY